MTFKNYDIIVTDDDAHEHVFAEIYYDGRYVGAVTQEAGLGKLIFEFPENRPDLKELFSKDDCCTALPVDVLVDKLQRATKRLHGSTGPVT